VELLVGLVILGLVAGGLQRFYAAMSRSVTTLARASEAEEGARIAIEVIQRDLRGAGFSTDGSLDRCLLYAAADAIRIASDLNGDHDTNDSNERVGYSFDAESRRLMRRMGDAPAQPMLNDLADEGLVLTYYGDDGKELAPVGGSLSEADRKRVARVDVSLTLELPNPNPQENQPLRSRQTATVSLRNAQKETR